MLWKNYPEGVYPAHRKPSKDTLNKLISSHALGLEGILVTNNEADFMAYTGLVIENWVNSH